MGDPQMACVPAPRMMQPAEVDALTKMANQFSKVTFVDANFQGKPGNLFLALAHAHEIGLPPAQAVQTLAVINGRVTIYGDGFLGVIQRSPAYEWHKETTKGTFPEDDYTAVCEFKRRGIDEPFRAEFSIADAKRAGKWECDPKSPWTKYPKRMLQMRARAWAGRAAFSDALRGLAMTEEVRDYEPAAQAPQERAFTRIPDPEDAPESKVVSVETAPCPMPVAPAPEVPVKAGDTVKFHGNGNVTVETPTLTYDEVADILNEWREATGTSDIMAVVEKFIAPVIGKGKSLKDAGTPEQMIEVVRRVRQAYLDGKTIIGPKLGAAEIKFPEMKGE